MSKICPNCQYPNLDKSETCFKCGADITPRALRVAKEEVREQERQERLAEASRRQERQNFIASTHENPNNTDYEYSFENVKDNIERVYKIFHILCIIGYIGCGVLLIVGFYSLGSQETEEVGVYCIMGSVIYSILICISDMLAKAIKLWLINISYNLSSINNRHE